LIKDELNMIFEKYKFENKNSQIIHLIGNTQEFDLK
jgi:hypothetical protein